MANLYLFSVLVGCMVIIHGYNARHNTFDRTYEQESEEKNHQIFESSSEIDDCIPVQAAKDLGCPLSTTNAMFKDLFNSVCHQHQLCYACGFAHNITARQCNELSLRQMRTICLARNDTTSLVNCFRKRFAAGFLLRLHKYQTTSNTRGYVFECKQPCVVDYLNSE